MWSFILLIYSVPASLSAVGSKEKVTGIVGRSITINCNYNARFKDNMKYWCHGWTVHCSYLVRTTDPGGQRGRMSIKDYKTQGVFVVTMEGLRTEDAGWYSCGINRRIKDELYAVKLEVFYDPVSLPLIRFLSPSNISCFEHSVSISCESARGSLPIRYTWYEKTTSEDSMISENNKLDLHCQLFKLQHHRYYCTASNTQGRKSSEMVKVSVIHRSESNCSYLAQIGRHGSTVVQAKNKVTGALGRAITIDCLYDKWSQLYVKFWSRQCSVLIKSNDHHGQRGRISIIDNKTQNMFSVTMEDLRSEDAGWYSCGVEQSGHISVSTEIELQVSHGTFLSGIVDYSLLRCFIDVLFVREHDSSIILMPDRNEGVSSGRAVSGAILTGPAVINGSVGQSVTIRCKYNKYYRTSPKYWCKGDNREDCVILIETQGPRKTNSGGRIIIAVDDDAGEFFVTMERLTKNDQGLYWCGISRFLWDLLSPVELNVAEGTKIPLAGSPSEEEILRQNSLYYFIWSILRWVFFAILLIWTILIKLKI
ncbi:polymeric immunoglobulin receptor-like [Rhincodon typus]|uniref:polymeric immunoglobulin receptor-like n=1 Tax=Rhincodon typus TaxID=259920 RepID=UPI0020302043|nr:polymeric immunoglobulin receptor-like [Rhincodon typus]